MNKYKIFSKYKMDSNSGTTVRFSLRVKIMPNRPILFLQVALPTFYFIN